MRATEVCWCQYSVPARVGLMLTAFSLIRDLPKIIAKRE